MTADRAPLHADRRRASAFGEDAQLYDRARPGYPATLVDYLVRETPRAVLDVGCGTGIASRLVVARGCHVLGIEPDGRMAAVAERHGIEVEVATFEEWDARARRFDLLISAQAWHWVDPSAGTAKAAEVLLSGGTFACFWNVGRPSAQLREAFDACYQKVAPGLEEYSVLLGRGDRDRYARCAEAFEEDGRFGELAITSFPHSIAYSRSAWLDHLETHSDHRILTPERRSALFEGLGEVIEAFDGSFTMPYEVMVVSGRRLG